MRPPLRDSLFYLVKCMISWWWNGSVVLEQMSEISAQPCIVFVGASYKHERHEAPI